MSRIFYDYLLEAQELEDMIKSCSDIHEEKEELWEIVDGIFSHRILDCIFGQLECEFHEEFISKLFDVPYDETVIICYLKEKIGDDVENLLKEEITRIKEEIVKGL